MQQRPVSEQRWITRGHRVYPMFRSPSIRVDKWIDDLARMFNPIIRGWINYYGRYYKSALYPTLRHLDRRLAHWAMAKYKRLRRHRRRAEHWIQAVASRDPALFAHWPLLHRATTGTVRAG